MEIGNCSVISYQLFSFTDYGILTPVGAGSSRPFFIPLTTHPSLARLILLIGLPGCGKSTLARQLLAWWPQCYLISTDAIRAKLFGDEAVQGPWLQVWREVERQFQQAAALAPTTIYDATNAQRRHRREVIATARKAGFIHITGVWLDLPLSLSLERNQQRTRTVPAEVILQMHRQLTDAPPSLQEELDRLIVLTEGKWIVEAAFNGALHAQQSSSFPC